MNVSKRHDTWLASAFPPGVGVVLGIDMGVVIGFGEVGGTVTTLHSTGNWRAFNYTKIVTCWSIFIFLLNLPGS